MFESLPTKIEAVRDKIARKTAARVDYTTNVSMARNRQRKWCNIF